jgi:hypothetical protein
LMASRTSEGIVNFGSFAGAYSYARIASLTTSVSAGDDGSSLVETEPQGCRPGPLLSRNQITPVLPAQAREAKESVLSSPSLSASTATGPHCPRIPAHRSIARFSTRSTGG